MAIFMRTIAERTQHGVTCKCCRDYGFPPEMTVGHTPMTTPDQTAVNSVISAGYKLSRTITGSTRCPVLMTTLCPNRNCFNHQTVRFPTLGHSKSHCPCDWRNAPTVSKLGEHMFPGLELGTCQESEVEGFGNIDAEELAIEQMIELDEESRMVESLDEYLKLLILCEEDELEWQAVFQAPWLSMTQNPKIVERIDNTPLSTVSLDCGMFCPRVLGQVTPCTWQQLIPLTVVQPPPPIEVVPPPPPIEVVPGYFKDSLGSVHIGNEDVIARLIYQKNQPFVIQEHTSLHIPLRQVV